MVSFTVGKKQKNPEEKTKMKHFLLGCFLGSTNHPNHCNYIPMVSALYCNMLKLNENWGEQYKGDLPANFMIHSWCNASKKE